MSFLPVFYPIVEVPIVITTALEAFPPAPVLPVPPPLPVLPTSQLGPLCGIGILTGLLLLGVGLLVLHLEVAAGIAALGAFSTWALTRRRARRQGEKGLADYHEALSCHLAYPVLRAQYELDLQKMTEALPRYREQRLAAVLKTIPLSSVPVPVGEFRKQGRSERHFLAYLQRHFGAETISVNCRVPVDDPRLNTSWYFPDFVYRDASGLCIDIEIDEPYALDNRKAIHCIGEDDLRNAFFLRKHWVVVRFTEEQVVRHPLLCCQALADVIFFLTRQHYAARLYYDRLPQQACWDCAQAVGLAERRTRESLLREVLGIGVGAV